MSVYEYVLGMLVGWFIGLIMAGVHKMRKNRQWDSLKADYTAERSMRLHYETLLKASSCKTEVKL